MRIPVVLEDSREVLLMAYDRSPIGRMIIYRLAKVAIKMKKFLMRRKIIIRNLWRSHHMII